MELLLPEEVTIVEMLPRDGFQRLDSFVPTDRKVDLIDRISRTGVDEIEFTSFTHSEAVPNLRDADELAKRINRHDDVVYRALVPNTVGMERAIAAEVDKVNALVVVSETYSRSNQNMTAEESIEEVRAIVEMASDADIEVEVGLGTSFFCPYEGSIPQEQTLSVVESVRNVGISEVTFATTMGMANPRQVVSMLTAAFERWPDLDVGLHLHDTNGMSLANTLVAMQCGLARFDASICGLGGGVVLPEGLQGVGNTPTEDLVNMLRELDVATGVDFERMEAVAQAVSEQLGLGATSHVLRGGTPEQILEATQDW